MEDFEDKLETLHALLRNRSDVVDILIQKIDDLEKRIEMVEKITNKPPLLVDVDKSVR